MGLKALLPLAISLLFASSTQAAYAPLDRPGPPLSVPQATLAAALHCSAALSGATREPVLLSPGTGVTVEQNFGFNYEPALTAIGTPWCAVSMPYNTLGDIQTAAEYLVYAIRTMRAAAGRPVAIIGHSQGGMSMRWALRFWPDTRPMVDDVIGFAPSNHGTAVVDQAGICASTCTPSVWQQRANSAFTRALNSGAETFAGISYTSVYTHTDEVVTPNSDSNGSSSLHTGAGQIANVATQQICPLDLDEHLLVGTIDPVAYALALDALTHKGPADSARIDPAVCAQPYMPGVSPLALSANATFLQSGPGLLAAGSPVNLVGAPEVAAEPPMRCYVTAACGAGGGPSPKGVSGTSPSFRRCRPPRHLAIGLPRGLRHASVRSGGRRLRIHRAHGHLLATLDLRHRTGGKVLVLIRGTGRNGRLVKLTRRYSLCPDVTEGQRQR